MKSLKYIELKTGFSDNGPAWIGYVTQSKSGRTVYFNGKGLTKLKGARRGDAGGNYVDMETGEFYWVSGVKKDGTDRHSAGSGKVLLEDAAKLEYLQLIGARTLNSSRFEITTEIRETDIDKLTQLANASGKGWPQDISLQAPYSFVRNVTFFNE